MRSVHFVLPGDIDDPASPSGGNSYDRAVLDRLPGAGWAVHEVVVPGSWPLPGTATRADLARRLATVPDGGVVLLDGLAGCAVPDLLAPEAARLRLVQLVHLPLGDETGRDPALAARLTARERKAVHLARAVIATSGPAARRLADLHGVARVAVAAPGVDPAPLTTPREDGRRLLCVAAVIPRKGQDVLVEALATLDDLAWECACVGSLEADAAFAKEVAGRAGRVAFTGPRTGADLDAAYAAADLLVLPSRAEPYGMVVTEALARGVPVLAGAVDGIPEAAGGAGLLVPPGDPAALAAALRRWLTEPALRADLRAAAAARRATLTGWDDTARRIADVLEEAR